MSALGEVLRRRFAGAVIHEPQPGVTYPELLVVDYPLASRWRVVALGLGGSLLGLVTFIVVAPAVIYLLNSITWVFSGSPGDLVSYARAAADFGFPAGMLATHLGLAVLIPFSFGLVFFVHRFNPRWLHSVQPGIRWRYLLASLLVAAVVLTGLWVVSRIGQPWVLAPERELWWFLVVIVLTSPLQAAAEEYFFRGYLLQALHTIAASSPWFGVVGSAAVFALLHGTQDLPLFLNRFAFGVLAGVLAVRTGGLEAGIAAHVVNNVVAFGYAALTGTMTVAKTVSTLGWAESGWNLLGFLVFTLVAVWVARRMTVATTTPGVRFGGPSEV